MNNSNVYFSWRTKKTQKGYMSIVTENTKRDTPNSNGSYVDSVNLKSVVLPTRARAKTYAQKCVRYYKAVLKSK